MTIYDGLNLSIIAFGVLLTKFKLCIGNRKVDGKFWFFVVSAALLIFLSAFRGDFTADYHNYVDLFNNIGGFTLKGALTADVFARIEKGFLVFTFFVKRIFNNPLYVFIFSSILIVTGNVWHIKKYADDYLLATMLFLVIGIYYTSFTILRQCMAVSIIVLGSKYLYERNFFKYLLVIFLACTFHRSAIIMLPFYFVATTKINKKLFVIYILTFFAMLFALPTIINIARLYSWDWYTISARGEMNWKTIVLPTALSLFSFAIYLINRKNTFSQAGIIKMVDSGQINKKDNLLAGINNIWLNGTFLYLYFKLCGLYLDLADRMSIYFSMYAILFYVHQIANSKHRRLLTFLIFLLLIIYEIVITHTPYYFIWD